MNARTVVARSLVATALSTVALAGLGAGTAQAATNWGPRCQSLHHAFTTYYNLAADALEQGDAQAYRIYDQRGDYTYAQYVKVGCNGG